jgi:hypothetical protein
MMIFLSVFENFIISPRGVWQWRRGSTQRSTKRKRRRG